MAFPAADSYVQRAGRTPLHAANTLAQAKHRVYGDLGDHRVIPFVIETFGACGPEATEFFEQCCAARRHRLGQEADTATWSTRTLGEYWRQRLEVAFLQTYGRGIQSRGARDWRPGLG